MEISLTQAESLLKEKHITASRRAIVNWAKAQLVDGWQDVSKRWFFDSESILKAINLSQVPRIAGKPPRYSAKQKLEMKTLKAQGKSLSQIAKIYQCDQSYVSLVVRNLR